MHKSGILLIGSLLTGLLLIGCPAFAAEEMPGLFSLEDAGGMLTLAEVQHPEFDKKWQKAPTGALNFGFTNSAYWLKFPLVNTEISSELKLIEIAFALIDYIDIYYLEGQKVIQAYHTGDRRPFDTRPVFHRNFIFPANLEAGKTLTVFIRVQSTDCIQIPIKVWDSKDFFAVDQQEMLVLGLFFGFLAIMLVYNLFLYFATRDRSYLYYVVFVGSMIYVQISQKGLGFQFFWPESISWNHVNLPFSLFMGIFGCFFFVNGFLGLNRRDHGWVATIATTGMVASLASAAGSFIIPYENIVLVAASGGPLMAVFLIYVGVSLWRKGNRSARFLTVAWLAFLSGIVLFALNRLGVIPRMLFTENAMLIGSALEAVLISLALADRIKMERDARISAQESALESERRASEAQKEALVIQKEANEDLEKKVKARTVELESAMQKLARANIKLNDLAQLDGLTGVYNRRYFDERLEHEWQRCRREKAPLSLLMIDIDHFKNINDVHGHLMGDKCLIHLAGTLQKIVKRPSDFVVRYGGEEFTITLPNTGQVGAGHVAEQARLAVEAQCLASNGKAIRLTVSVGVATVVPGEDPQILDLIKAADQALYLAKARGRNQVSMAEDITGVELQPRPVTVGAVATYEK